MREETESRKIADNVDYEEIKSLQGLFIQKWKCYHHLLTLMLFQTCMNTN